MTTKIVSFQIENVKRVQAVEIALADNYLTLIGGNNQQGKSTLLDSIAWTLGGDKFRPSKAKRYGAIGNPTTKIVLSNGLVVERKGKNSTLKITDPKGLINGQALLNQFISQLALDLPKFLNASNTEKAKILLNIIGVEEQLAILDDKEKELYSERLLIGRDADRKSKFAEELQIFDGVPESLITASELIHQQQKILLQNEKNRELRNNLEQMLLQEEHSIREIQELEGQLSLRMADLYKLQDNIKVAQNTSVNIQDESITEIEEQLNQIEETNAKIRANLDKHKAEEDAIVLKGQYDNLTNQVDKVRSDRLALLNSVELPLTGLSIDNGELTFNSQRWDCMSGVEQLQVATAIVRKLNPMCGFVLIDKLEQMDLVTLNQFKKWLEQENLQVIATRVSTGEECSIIINDGLVSENHIIKAHTPTFNCEDDF